MTAIGEAFSQSRGQDSKFEILFRFSQSLLLKRIEVILIPTTLSNKYPGA